MILCMLRSTADGGIRQLSQSPNLAAKSGLPVIREHSDEDL